MRAGGANSDRFARLLPQTGSGSSSFASSALRRWTSAAPCNCGASSSAMRVFTNFTSATEGPFGSRMNGFAQKPPACTKSRAAAQKCHFGSFARRSIKIASFPNRARSSAIVTLAAGS